MKYTSNVFKLNVTLLSVLIISSLRSVSSLPLGVRPSSESSLPGDGLASLRQGYGLRGEEGKERRARDIGLVQENETATVVIYSVNEQLLHEFPDWLVEIDIVRSPMVEELRQSGINEGPGGEGEALTSHNVDQRKKKAAFNVQHHGYLYWPNARVPYAFHPYIAQEVREAVWSAMDVWMAYTCIKFVPVEPDDEDYVEFVEMHGCWSYVGRQGGDQKLSVGVPQQRLCKYRGVLLHELGHSLGFFHEQTRPDRDEYVEIIWENMLSSAYSNFIRYSSYEVDSSLVPYDYASIMHYPRKAFTRNGQDTIVPLEPVTVIGQRNDLSPLDIKQANLLYQCQTVVNETEISEVALSLIDPIPDNAFQIMNVVTNTCLTAVKRSENTIDVSSDSPQPYGVSMVQCNSSQPQQFWQWTDNDTIVNTGSYLCLTAVDGAGSDGEREGLALMPCVKSDGRQRWNCAREYIEQPTSGKCLTATVEGRNDSAATNESFDDGIVGSRALSHSRTATHESASRMDRNERDTFLSEMVKELGQFLQEANETGVDRADKEDSSSSDMSQSNQSKSKLKPMVSVQYCSLQNYLQLWAGIPKSKLTNRSDIDSRNTICSLNGTMEHNLSPCYTNDMASIAPMVSQDGYSYTPEEWLVCDRRGYYVTGFYHTSHEDAGLHVRDGLVTGMQCCATSSVFTGELEGPPAPVNHREDDCDEVEWWSFQDVLISEGWFSCPKGKFLKGFKVGPSIYHYGVHRIYKALCCRPPSASDVYEHCYTDKSRRVDNTGVHGCRMEGYLVTAMYLKGCVENDDCLEQLTCCIES